MKFVVRYMLVLMLVSVCAFSITLGIQKTVWAIDNLRVEDEEMRKLVTVYHEIMSNYVEIKEASPTTLMEGAVYGMLQTLDPYSQYFPPTEYKKFTEQTQGEFAGIGIRINISRREARWLPGWLTVVEPIKGTPATKCKALLEGKEIIGLKPDDKIVKIADESTRNMSLETAVGKLKGPPGSTVTVQIARKPTDDGLPQLLDFNMERAHIAVPPIEEDDIKMIDDKIGYIWLKDFTSHAHEALYETITNLKAQGMQGLVLDLRDNTGGLLEVAIKICEMFINKGEIVLEVKSRHGKDDETYYSRSEPIYSAPMTVLVNQNSASASEIVAGCLQDHHRALLVGPAPEVNTYGKGSVQTVIKFDDGSGLKLTTAQWFTPNHQKIHNQGIKPNAWSDMSFDYWLRLREAEKVGYLKPKMLPGQKEDEKEKAHENSPVTMEELLGATAESADLKDLYDRQLFFAAQLLHLQIDEGKSVSEVLEGAAGSEGVAPAVIGGATSSTN
jgi:carboxyl-terminal processing protease